MKTSTLILIIVILVLLLIVIGAIYYGVYKLKQKTREFSRQVFGTDSLKEGFEQIEAEYAVTPKSVSAVTSLYLPKITKDFPEFSYDEMKDKARNVLTSYLLAINDFDPGKLTEGTSELKNKLEHIIILLKNKDQREHFDKIKILVIVKDDIRDIIPSTIPTYFLIGIRLYILGYSHYIFNIRISS